MLRIFLCFVFSGFLSYHRLLTISVYCQRLRSGSITWFSLSEERPQFLFLVFITSDKLYITAITEIIREDSRSCIDVLSSPWLYNMVVDIKWWKVNFITSSLSSIQTLSLILHRLNEFSCGVFVVHLSVKHSTQKMDFSKHAYTANCAPCVKRAFWKTHVKRTFNAW